MRLEPVALALGLCLSSLSLAQSNSSGSDGCRVVKTVITNGVGQVIETKDTKICDKPKAAKPAPGEMTPEERKAALARLQELNRQAEEDRKNMRAIEEKYFTPEELERQPSLAGACMSSYLRDGRTQSQRPWAKGVTFSSPHHPSSPAPVGRACRRARAGSLWQAPSVVRAHRAQNTRRSWP